MFRTHGKKPADNCYPRKTMQPAKPPLLKAILTDVHFWLPFVVLIIGIALLAALR
jgi:hypothetical protein